jgi:hypothetical protein
MIGRCIRSMMLGKAGAEKSEPPPPARPPSPARQAQQRRGDDNMPTAAPGDHRRFSPRDRQHADVAPEWRGPRAPPASVPAARHGSAQARRGRGDIARPRSRKLTCAPLAGGIASSMSGPLVEGCVHEEQADGTLRRQLRRQRSPRRGTCRAAPSTRSRGKSCSSRADRRPLRSRHRAVGEPMSR